MITFNFELSFIFLYLYSLHHIYININTISLMIFLYSAGVVNRGDSFRRRRSRSNSLAPAEKETEIRRLPPKEVASHNVAMLGTRGVGKTALISQFMTSECINAYDRQKGEFYNHEVIILYLCSGNK